MAYSIDSKLCVGCGACAFMCLFDIPQPVTDAKEEYFIDIAKCLGCGQCKDVCPNGAIRALPDHKDIKKVSINDGKCIGCSLCAKKCPAGAPSGELKSPFKINEEKCFKCGFCATVCKKDAIEVMY